MRTFAAQGPVLLGNLRFASTHARSALKGLELAA